MPFYQTGESSIRGFHFWLDHMDEMPLVAAEGVMINLIETDGQLEVAIRVRDDATYEDIQRTIPLALQWRDALRARQGARRPDVSFMKRLIEMHDGGTAYRELAKRANEGLARTLTEYVEHEQLREQLIGELHGALGEDVTNEQALMWLKSEYPETWSKYFRLLYHGPGFGWYLDDVKETVGLLTTEKGESIDEILAGALASIRQGREPFPDDYPVSRDSLRYCLNYWRREKLPALDVDRGADVG